jgi:predicted permease
VAPFGSGLALDFRAAVRALLASRAVSGAAVLTLGLAIAAVTAIFSVANALLLRPLPVSRPERLVTISSETALRFGFAGGAGWNYGMWDRLRDRAEAFDGAFAWTLQRFELAESGESQSMQALMASGDVFRTLGVNAAAGRTFTSQDDVRGGGPEGPVVVISHDLWHRRFNADATAIGSHLSIEGTSVTIIGVAPRSFRGIDVGQRIDLVMPFATEAIVRGGRSLVASERALLFTVMLRLKPGQTPPQAASVLRALQPEIVGTKAPPFLKEPFVIVPASTGLTDRSRLRQVYERPLVTLGIVSGLVLLIVSVNLANLFLARAASRRCETSIRLAIGASRWRLARQLFVEGVLLAAIATAAAVPLAAWASHQLVTQLPAAGPVAIDLSLDWRVLLFTTGVMLSAVLVFVLVPAFYASRVGSLEAMQESGRAASGRRTAMLSSAAIFAQVALSIVLLAAAGVFVGTLERLANVPLGFDPHNVVILTVNVPRSAQAQGASLALYDRVVEAVRAVPGVLQAAGSVWTPVGSGGGLLTDARGRRAELGRPLAFNFVTPDWFTTYRMALRSGRDFDARDSANAPRVAIVNETLLRNLGRDRATSGTVQAGPCPDCTIVGVVADAIYGGSLRDAPPPTLYLPLAQSAGRGPSNAGFRVSIRTAGDVSRLLPDLTAALRGVDARMTFTLKPIDADIHAALAQERLMALLAGFFGVMALLLSAVGLYGVAAFVVGRRRGEIGIRLALGAPPTHVLRGIVGRLMLFVAVGAIAGLGVTIWLARFVAPLVYGLEARDPATLAGATLTLLAVAGAAALFPAWRATQVDPARVLREN